MKLIAPRNTTVNMVFRRFAHSAYAIKGPHHLPRLDLTVVSTVRPPCMTHFGVLDRRKGTDRRIAGPAAGRGIPVIRRATPWGGKHWAGAPRDAKGRATSRGEGALRRCKLLKLGGNPAAETCVDGEADSQFSFTRRFPGLPESQSSLL